MRGHTGGIHTLVLVGELDRSSTATLEAAIEDLCQRGVDGITLDLGALERIDATGVAVIAFRCHWCERRGLEFALLAGPPPVQRAFAQAGVLERLPFVEAPQPPNQPQRVLVVGA